MIQTSKISQPSQYSGINISNLGNNATINITPFTNLLALDVSSANNNISSTQLNFNTFSNIQTFRTEASSRSSSNPGISFNVNGTNSSVRDYTAESSVVTSLLLKNPTYDYSLDLNIGQIPTGLRVLNIEGNALTGEDLASILCSFSGMAKNNNITGGDLNILPYNNLGMSLTPHLTDSINYYRDVWLSDDGQYQIATQLSGNASALNEGNLYISMNYGIDWSKIANTGLPKTGVAFWRGCAASNDIKYIVAVARSGRAYMSDDSGNNFHVINLGSGNSQSGLFNLNLNFSDVAVSSAGQFINITVNSATDYTTSGMFLGSSDYGNTWSAKTTVPIGPEIGNIGVRWSATSISANGQYQNASLNAGGKGGVFVSNDYGATWTAKQSYPFFFNSNVREISMSLDGKYQIATAENIYTSSDYGVTWRIAYTDYYKYSSQYWIQNRFWQGGCDISADGKYQVACLNRSNLFKKYPGTNYYYLSEDGPGALFTSSDYGVTWQKTAFTGKWRTVALSADKEYLILGDESYVYTSITNGSDTTYGVFLSAAFNAAKYLINIKQWTVKYIKTLFN